jgi:hypothetical protein
MSRADFRAGATAATEPHKHEGTLQYKPRSRESTQPSAASDELLSQSR